ncbi:MAG TPA: NAD(P)/FAD-dependent oxidoreductase [Kineosporiaceae bacterium]|nr:NAD(P)/FAD-dependent oxidoreductase [Kineosporiaceae bacterium]
MTESTQPNTAGVDEFDIVVIGTGSAGQPLAAELARAGRSVLAIEAGLVGGECAYLACIPSKAMLLAAQRHRARTGPAGSTEPDPAAYAGAVAVRDHTTRNRDDSVEATALEKDGVTLLRGQATVDGHSVKVDSAAGDRTVRWRQALVLATGSQAVIPPIDGLTSTTTWTSPNALSDDELPNRLTILGGGAIGCELAQVYASFGSAVTLIEAAPTLLAAEADWIGEAMADVLRKVGVDVRTGTEVTAVESDGTETSTLVRTADGAEVATDRILVAVGKRPRSSGFGLDSLGITAQENGALGVDARCRVIAESGVLDDVYAIGDLTALAPYTHTANYHARIVTAHLLGRGQDADHVGIPRVVYTDPPVFCTGETEDAARERGAHVLSARCDATETSRSALERASDPEDHRPAGLELIADADTGVLLGASAIGPEADSWAAELALAVRARLTVHTLAQHLHAFPSWTEAIHVPARSLAEQIPATSP